LTGYAARIGKINPHKLWFAKPEGKRYLWRPRLTGEDNMEL